MNRTLSRRAFFPAAAASGLAESAPAVAAQEIGGIALRGPVPFRFDSVIATAREMLLKPFASTPVRGAELPEKIDFDACRQIAFKLESALFKALRCPVRMFHLGRYFKLPGKIAILEGGQSRGVLYSPDLFTPGPQGQADRR